MATHELNILPFLPCNICFITGFACLFGLLCLYISSLRRFASFSLRGKHVAITGGTSGIGKALAQQALEKGASVTLIARTVATLESSQKELESYAFQGEKVWICSVDIGSNAELVDIEFKRIVDQSNRPIDVLINCAGTSVPGVFEELDPNTFNKMMSVNYLGSVYPTRAVVPSMKERRTGRIVFVSSQAGQVGIYGFSAYSASKFAVVGLAQVLRMELKPYGITVGVAYPPDTDTPGFEEENKCKPEATRLLSETSGLFTPQQVAKDIIRGLHGGDFTIYSGLDGWMLSNVTAGMSPPNSWFHGFIQVLITSLLRLIGLFYSNHFDNIVNGCIKKKDKQKKHGSLI